MFSPSSVFLLRCMFYLLSLAGWANSITGENLSVSVSVLPNGNFWNCRCKLRLGDRVWGSVAPHKIFYFFSGNDILVYTYAFCKEFHIYQAECGYHSANYWGIAHAPKTKRPVSSVVYACFRISSKKHLSMWHFATATLSLSLKPESWGIDL